MLGFSFCDKSSTETKLRAVTPRSSIAVILFREDGTSLLWRLIKEGEEGASEEKTNQWVERMRMRKRERKKEETISNQRVGCCLEVIITGSCGCRLSHIFICRMQKFSKFCWLIGKKWMQLQKKLSAKVNLLIPFTCSRGLHVFAGAPCGAAASCTLILYYLYHQEWCILNVYPGHNSLLIQIRTNINMFERKFYCGRKTAFFHKKPAALLTKPLTQKLFIFAQNQTQLVVFGF